MPGDRQGRLELGLGVVVPAQFEQRLPTRQSRISLDIGVLAERLARDECRSLTESECIDGLARLLRELGGDATVGPILVGMEKPVQIVPVTANVPDVLTLAVLAAAGIVE